MIFQSFIHVLNFVLFVYICLMRVGLCLLSLSVLPPTVGSSAEVSEADLEGNVCGPPKAGCRAVHFRFCERVYVLLGSVLFQKYNLAKTPLVYIGKWSSKGPCHPLP